MKWPIALVLCVAVAVLGSCRRGDSDIVTGTGTVHHGSVECTAWFLRSDADQEFELTSLPADFQRDGLRVRFMLKLRPDLVSICMAGRIAEVVEIRGL